MKAWRKDNESTSTLLGGQDAVDPGALMIQEVIPGGGESQFSYTALCKDDGMHRLRQAARTDYMDFGVPALS